jgi:hypothetical protein
MAAGAASGINVVAPLAFAGNDQVYGALIERATAFVTPAPHRSQQDISRSSLTSIDAAKGAVAPEGQRPFDPRSAATSFNDINAHPGVYSGRPNIGELPYSAAARARALLTQLNTTTVGNDTNSFTNANLHIPIGGFFGTPGPGEPLWVLRGEGRDRAFGFYMGEPVEKAVSMQALNLILGDRSRKETDVLEREDDDESKSIRDPNPLARWSFIGYVLSSARNQQSGFQEVAIATSGQAIVQNIWSDKIVHKGDFLGFVGKYISLSEVASRKYYLDANNSSGYSLSADTPNLIYQLKPYVGARRPTEQELLYTDNRGMKRSAQYISAGKSQTTKAFARSPVNARAAFYDARIKPKLDNNLVVHFNIIS